MREILFHILEINIGAAVVISVFLMCAEKLRKRYGAVWMKTVWLLLAIRLAIPYNFSLPFIEIPLFDIPEFVQETDTENPLSTSDAGVDADVQYVNTANGGAGVGWKRMDETDIDADGKQMNGVGIGANGQQMNAADIDTGAGGQQMSTAGVDAGVGWQQADVTGIKTERRQTDIVGIMLYIYLFGVGACLLYVLIGYLSFYHRCRKSIRPLRDERLKERILVLQKQITGKVCVPVCQSYYITSPMIIGIFQPRLVLPVSGKEWNEEKLQFVMEHELCHYQKKDLLLKFFMTIVWCMNWFNPAVFLMKKQFFYDVELACDETVLKKHDDKEKEAYARIILSVAGNGTKAPMFSTGFTEDKKRMKNRIDYIFDKRKRKKGAISMTAACIIILTMSVVVSCGYREQTDTTDGESAEAYAPAIPNVTAQNETEPNETSNAKQEEYAEFDYNHEYNALIRVYENDVYIARENGIYRVEDGVGEETLIFENAYMTNRGMEIYQHYLYFTGRKEDSEKAEKEKKTAEIEESSDTEAATIYRMNLENLEVEDALAAYDYHLEYLHNISIYEEKLYVSEGFGHRTGFTLSSDGEIGSMLDENADDFLYKENNTYVEWYSKRINTSYGTEESDALMEEEAKLYQPIADTAACKKLLHGSFVVSRYKDELRRAAYLEHEDGTYEYLCDIYDGYELITENGLYYMDGVSGDIMYVDFETKKSETILKQPEEDWMQLCLLTYDTDYIYLATNRHLGFDEEDNLMLEISLQRIPREGGRMEKLYQFESGIEWRMPWRLAGHCGVYGEYMYLAYYETIHLEP